MARRTVEIPRALLVVLASALGVSLLALAFMLGRETGREAPPDEPAASNQSASGPAPPPVTATLPPSTVSSTPPPVQVPSVMPRPEATVSPATQPASPPTRIAPPMPAASSTPSSIPPAPSLESRERAAIERYFNEVEAVSSPGEVGASPDALAQALLSQGTQGDWSSFDKLVRDQRNVLSQLQRITVPPACRTYHNRSVDLVHESIRLLEDVKRGVQSGNLGGLQALSAKAQTLQSDANEVAALGTQIKQRYGLN